MSINVIIGILLIISVILIMEYLTRRLRKGQNVGKSPNLNIKEETTTKLILEMKSTNTVFTVDLNLGVVTHAETQTGKTVNQSALPIDQIDKIVLTFEDMPSGIAHLARAKLMFITTQGQEFEVVQEDRYFETSQIAEKIAQLLHKNVENRILGYGTF